MSQYYPPQQPEQSGSEQQRQFPQWPQQNTGYPQWQEPQQFPQQPYYPPQQPPYPPQPYYPPQQYPPPLPSKKSRKTLWIVLGVIAAVVILVGCSLGALMIGIVGGSLAAPSINATATAEASSSGINSDTTQTSTQPAATGTWTTTHTFTGNGIQKTANFTAPDDWKILYSCAAQAVGDGTYVDGVLGVIVTGTDNTPIDVAVNATCKAGSAKTTGQTEEHQGGQVYLDINATGDWTVQIQELK